MKKDFWGEDFGSISRLIFFFNVFIAFMIIGFGTILVKTDFGKGAVYFGFIMLAVSSVLKVLQKW